jgi:hypothetical protein
MMNPHAHQRVARALLHEVDRTFRRYYHQTLTDVVQDLKLRNILRGEDQTPETLLLAIHRTGILQMNPSPTILEMETVLTRFVRGTVDVCTRCGDTIALKDLEQRPTLGLCSKCRAKNLTRGVKEVTR